MDMHPKVSQELDNFMRALKALVNTCNEHGNGMDILTANMLTLAVKAAPCALANPETGILFMKVCKTIVAAAEVQLNDESKDPCDCETCSAKDCPIRKSPSSGQASDREPGTLLNFIAPKDKNGKDIIN